MSGGRTMPAASRTDVGRRREHNEDAIVAAPPMIAVADGVGGSARGEVASRTALDTFQALVAPVAAAATSGAATAAMEHAVLLANAAVHEAQLRDDALRGMATTLTAAVARDGGEVIVGHVGDSRLYVISALGARQLSADHSVVAELVRSGRLAPEDAAHHPQRNAITRALGPDPDVSVDAFVEHVGPGDWLLVCSDGLTEHVADGEIARVILERPRDPEAVVTHLVDLANERGGTDNISVAVLQPVPSDVSGELSIQALEAAAATTSQFQVPVQSDAPHGGSGPLPTVDATATMEPRSVEASGELPVLQPLQHPEEDDAGFASYYLREATSGSRRGRTIAIIGLVVLLAAVAGAFVWSQSYFLVEREDGRVGIDRGFPVAGLAAAHRSSDVAASELTAADRERLVESHRLLDREDAERVLDQLPERVEPAGEPSTGEANGGDTAPA